MLEDFKHTNATDIDFNKFGIILKANLFWLILIFVTTNAIAYLYIRYTKDLFESVSEIKLDVKKEASDFGIRDLATENNLNLISGEIETIQSKLFLNTVIDSLDLDITYYSIGQWLNYELYKSSPFTVTFTKVNGGAYNTPFYIEQTSSSTFELKQGENGEPKSGNFNIPFEYGGSELIVSLEKDGAFQKDINYSFIFNSREALISYLQSNLTVEPLNFNANTIKVSFKDYNAFKARDLANSIDSLYLQFSNTQKNLANKQKIDWINRELSQIERRLGDYENYFENFTLSNKTSDLKADLKQTISQIHKIDSQRFEISKRITDINQLMDGLPADKLLLTPSQRNILPAFVSSNIDKLQVLTVEMDKMKLSYNENTFAFRQKEKELESIQTAIRTELTGIKSDLLKRSAELTNSKNRLESAFINMPDKNTQFGKNERFYQLYEEFYLTLMQHKSEFEIAQAGSTPDFKLLSSATLPSTPIAPRKAMIQGVGFMAGVVINIFLLGFLYLINNKITNVDEIEKATGVPLLSVIPTVKKKTEGGFYILDHPKSMVSEAIRTLRTNLDYFSINNNHKLIAISSTISGEGKSFISLNLGAIIALSNKRVVLLDLDMRKAKPHSPVEQKDTSKGISTILIKKNSWQECVLKTPVEGYDVIPSGPQPPNPSELLMTDEFSKLLTELKPHYDFILLDTPPVGLVTDGIMAMKQADISIYIFRANYSKRDFVNNLLRIMKVNKFSNVTTVLNALPATHEKYYGYYDEAKKTNWLKSIFNRG
jgi:tyrosine-protein kinase Etk/Wzc